MSRLAWSSALMQAQFSTPSVDGVEII